MRQLLTKRSMNSKTRYVFLWKETFLFFFKVLCTPLIVIAVASILPYEGGAWLESFFDLGIILGCFALGAFFITAQIYSEMRSDQKEVEKAERNIMGDSHYETCKNVTEVEYFVKFPLFESRLLYWIFGGFISKREQEKEQEKDATPLSKE